MVSVITDRVAASVEGAPVTIGGLGTGIIQATNIAGTDTITGDTLSDIEEYATNQYFSIRPFAANTGPVTLDLDDVGPADWLKPNGSPLDANDLSPNLEYLLKFDGTAFRTVAPGF